jgi:hypothetical protein
VKAAFGVLIALVLLGTSPAVAATSGVISRERAHEVTAQASPSPSQATQTGSPTASPSPGAEGNERGISTGAGIVIAAILIGGLLLMRSRLLRR